MTPGWGGLQLEPGSVRATLDRLLAGPRQENIAQTRTLQHRFESELQLAEKRLEDTHLYAPSDAVVQERILEIEDMASPQKPAFAIALVDPVYVAESGLGKIHEGMPATIDTDSFPDKEYR